MKPAEISIMILLILQLAAPAAWSETAELPAVIERGLTAFKTQGARAAVENWTRGGPLDNTKGENIEIDAVQDLERLYGRYQGFAVLEQVRLSSASRLIYLEVQLTEGPIYFRLRVYRGKKGEDLVGIKVDRVPERILPEFLLEKLAAMPSGGR